MLFSILATEAAAEVSLGKFSLGNWDTPGESRLGTWDGSLTADFGYSKDLSGSE